MCGTVLIFFSAHSLVLIVSHGVFNCIKTCKETLHVLTRCVVFFNKGAFINYERMGGPENFLHRKGGT